MVGIIGYGPRTGTSFVMQTLARAGAPIVGEKHIEGWTAEQNNPEGHYELEPSTLVDGLVDGSFDNKILKVWPTALMVAKNLKTKRYRNAKLQISKS